MKQFCLNFLTFFVFFQFFYICSIYFVHSLPFLAGVLHYHVIEVSFTNPLVFRISSFIESEKYKVSPLSSVSPSKLIQNIYLCISSNKMYDLIIQFSIKFFYVVLAVIHLFFRSRLFFWGC